MNRHRLPLADLAKHATHTAVSQVIETVADLGPDRIGRLMPERPPTLMLKAASILKHVQNHEATMITAFGNIPAEACRGHFPGYPVAPLAQTALLLAQSGALLLSWSFQKPNTAYLVVSLNDLRTGRRGPIVPGETLCASAQVLALRKGTARLEGILSDETGRRILTMSGILYFEYPIPPLNRKPAQ